MPGLTTAAYGWNVRELREKGHKRRRACPAKRSKSATQIACPTKRDFCLAVARKSEGGSAASRVGRTVQVRVRAAVRSNQAACRQKRQFLGTCSKPQSPSACGTQAISCFRGGLLSKGENRRWPRRCSSAYALRATADRSSSGWPVPRARAARCADSGIGRPGAAGAVNRPAFRTPPRGRRKQRRPTSLEVGINTGR
jgi:hypothetical protein